MKIVWLPKAIEEKGPSNFRKSLLGDSRSSLSLANLFNWCIGMNVIGPFLPSVLLYQFLDWR